MDERERAYVAKLMYFTLFFSLQGDLFGSVDLGRSRSARVRTFSGKVLVDIREFYTGRDGQPMPGKKGISLNPEEWAMLRDCAADIDAAIAAATGTWYFSLLTCTNYACLLKRLLCSSYPSSQR